MFSKDCIQLQGECMISSIEMLYIDAELIKSFIEYHCSITKAIKNSFGMCYIASPH